MNWGAKQHPVETIVDWIAPIPLAMAAGWAGTRFGLSLIEAAAIGAVALAAGFATMKIAGSSRAGVDAGFGPVAFDGLADGQPGELLLEAKDEVLLLDDPLVDAPEGSRVVRLFSRHQATPGELVERIEGFLDEVRRPASPAEIATEQQRPADASAALHAALANIRASLR